MPPDSVFSSQSYQPTRAYLVFFDSTDLHWCPDVGRGYVACGCQPITDSPGKQNPWYALFGSLIYPSGEGLYTIDERKRHQEVAAHLKLLLDSDRQAFWYIVLDNAGAHTTPMLLELLGEYCHRIEFVFQPTYSPHLNLIERLWGFMRNQMTRNQFYDSLKEQAKAIVDWLQQLLFSRFCSLMGCEDPTLEAEPQLI